jgi:hypothetical protein
LTLRHVYKLICNALGDAHRMELVTRNVAEQVKAPPVSRQRRVGLDVAEAKRLFEVIESERLTPELVSRFRQHRVQQAEAQMAAGPLWQDRGLISAQAVMRQAEPHFAGDGPRPVRAGSAWPLV